MTIMVVAVTLTTYRYGINMISPNPRGFPDRGALPPQGTFGNVWGQFWLSPSRGAAGIQSVEVMDAAKNPSVRETVPHSKESPSPTCQQHRG